MSKQRTLGVALSILGLGLVGPPSSKAQVVTSAPQTPAAQPSSLEIALLRSLQANPLTSPYLFTTEPRGRQVILRGRVGTKRSHDAAIQTAIALGVPVVDGLLIDTAAAHQAAAVQSQGGPGYGPGMASPGYGAAGYGLGFPGAGAYGPIPYTYPQPILGKLDDPFYGFEPPAVGYPPWWGPLTARRLGNGSYPSSAGLANNQQGAVDPSLVAPNSLPIDASAAQPGDLPYGTIDMAIDPRGVATLRGVVPSLAERIAIGQRVAQTPGVSQVINLLNIKAGATAAPTAPTVDDRPPPPPVPANAPNAPRPVAPVEGQAIPVDADPVAQRVSRAISSRSALAGQPIRVKVRDGLATLSGKVPTVYEAMLAYRAVQQTPGVREVDDRLEFVVPDGNDRNPLAEKGRPEDVEPYLEAQIRRQVGDLAHIDRVRVQGDALEIRGTLGREEDRARFDAILRSMAILRGFRMTAEIPVESR